MDGIFGLPRNSLADIQVFNGHSTSANPAFVAWRKRPGITMIHILAVGAGAGGGSGVVGANSTAAGGGGGGPGAHTSMIIPAAFLPDTLFVSVAGQSAASAAGATSRVCILPETQVGSTIIQANGGSAGGNGAGATAGASGVGAVTSALTAMSIAGLGVFQAFTGVNAGAGGTTGGAGTVAFPTGGQICCGGAGGGGLGAAAANGSTGGALTSPTGLAFPSNVNTSGFTTLATTPGPIGNNGFQFHPVLKLFLGGGGGGSSHGSATGAGLFGGNGGNGAIGSGGGGGGGCLTGGVAGIGGIGGPGLVIITAW